MEVVETDLGEYIIQMEGETPSHIIVPAIHKNGARWGGSSRTGSGAVLRRSPGADEDRPQGVREKFLSATPGSRGELRRRGHGSLVLFTNEGNGRMVTTVPPLHVAVENQ